MHFFANTGTLLRIAALTIAVAGCAVYYLWFSPRAVTAIPPPAAQVATENGAWLWKNVLRITPADMDSLVATAKKNGIDTIYISINPYLGVLYMKSADDRAQYGKKLDDAFETFIQAAHQNGIAVDAEAGAPNWAEDGQADTALAALAYVKEFNRTHALGFRGFQYDVEPYLLPRYETNKKDVLVKFLDLVGRSLHALEGSNVRFSVVIPDFYDAQAAQTPRFLYDGTLAYAYDHLLSLLSKRPGSTIIVMAYRDHALGSDGAVAIAKNEVKKAEGSPTRVVVALEVGDVGTPGISFFGEAASTYLTATREIRDAFSDTTSFGGVATDHIEALEELKER